jgi:hypothetical protein
MKMSPRHVLVGLLLAVAGCSGADREENARLKSELEQTRDEVTRLKQQLAKLEEAKKAPAEVGDVLGKVTFEGAPIPSGTVEFHPKAGASVKTQIQPDGTYQAKNVPAGDVVVTVTPPAAPKPEKEKDKAKDGEKKTAIPAKYAKLETGIPCTIKAGQQFIDFELK